MHPDFIAAASEFGEDITGQHFGITASHVNIQIGKRLQIIQCIIESNSLSVRVIGVRHLIRHLNLVNKQIEPVRVTFHLFPHRSGQRKRISVTDILRKVQFERKNVIFCNTLLQQIVLKDCTQQIGLAAPTYTGNYLDLPIPHERDDFF